MGEGEVSIAFLAYINHNKRREYLGRFVDREDASAAYRDAKKRLHSFRQFVREEEKGK